MKGCENRALVLTQKNGTMKEKLRNTRLGEWLKREAPEILDAVGDAIPDQGVLGFVKNLLGAKLENDKEAQLLIQELEIKQLEAVSARWEADMKSTSTLSKNVRPVALIALLSMMFAFAVVDSIGSLEFDVKPEYIEMLKMLSMTAFGAYFAGRSYEKTRKND